MSASAASATSAQNPRFLSEIALAFYDLVQQLSGGMSQDNKDSVIRTLEENGFTIKWNALR